MTVCRHIIFGVYAALQQWDGLFQFAYAHGMKKIQYDSPTDGYFDLMTDPVKLLSQYLGSTFFLNGELANGNTESYGIVILSSSGNERCYALDMAGNRLAEIPVRNGKINLQVFQKSGQIFAYELEKRN